MARAFPTLPPGSTPTVTISPLGRGVAALAMSLIAAATVVSLTRADAPAHGVSDDADLPGIAAAAPDVATQKLADTGVLDPDDLPVDDGLPLDPADDEKPSKAKSGGSATKPATTPASQGPTTPPPSSAPEPEPEPAPAPSPKPTKKPSLLDILFGKK